MSPQGKFFSMQCMYMGLVAFQKLRIWSFWKEKGVHYITIFILVKQIAINKLLIYFKCILFISGSGVYLFYREEIF